MSLDDILRKLWRHYPTTAEEALVKCGFKLEHLGTGSFRNTYRILESDYVLKMPRTSWTASDSPNGDVDFDWLPTHQAHSRTEYKAVNEIVYSEDPKVQALIPHLPRILWFDWESAVALMQYYKPTEKRHAGEIRHVRKKFVKALKKSCDVFQSNTGVDHRGNVIVLDMGLVYDGKTEANERPVPPADVPHNTHPLQRA